MRHRCVVQHQAGPRCQPLHDVAGQALIVRLADIDAIEVVQLGVVHARRGTTDAVQIEQPDRLLAVQHLDVAVAPAEPQQVIAQRLGQVALLAELQGELRAVALRQFRPVRAVDQRQMRESGRSQPIAA